MMVEDEGSMGSSSGADPKRFGVGEDTEKALVTVIGLIRENFLSVNYSGGNQGQ